MITYESSKWMTWNHTENRHVSEKSRQDSLIASNMKNGDKLEEIYDVEATRCAELLDMRCKGNIFGLSICLNDFSIL